MKKTLCLLLTLLMLTPIVSSCNTSGENPDVQEKEPTGTIDTTEKNPAETIDTTEKNPANTMRTTNVIRPGGIQEYGPYVIPNLQLFLAKYSTVTHQWSKVCSYPMCDECACHGQITPGGIVDGKLYFRSSDIGPDMHKMKTRTYYASYDLATGETNVLGYWKTDSGLDAPFGCHVWEDYLYYWMLDRSEETEATNASAYSGYVYRIPLAGGEHEKLCALEKGEGIGVVMDGYIITGYNGNIYRIDLETFTKEKFFSRDENGYRNLLGSQYLDGKIYMRASTTEYLENEYNSRKDYKSYLISIDIHTGEVKRVVDEPVRMFNLTDEGIYYYPQTQLVMYMPEDYKEHPEDVVIYEGDDTIHFCNFDGSGDRVVYQNGKLFAVLQFTVIDNVYYGYVMEYDEEDHSFGSLRFVTIDFATGEVTEVPKPPLV